MKSKKIEKKLSVFESFKTGYCKNADKLCVAFTLEFAMNLVKLVTLTVHQNQVERKSTYRFSNQAFFQH